MRSKLQRTEATRAHYTPHDVRELAPSTLGGAAAARGNYFCPLAAANGALELHDFAHMRSKYAGVGLWVLVSTVVSKYLQESPNDLCRNVYSTVTK